MPYNNIFLKSYQYVMDIILLYIVFCLLYIHTENLPPILPFVVITGVGAILIVFLLNIMKSNTPYFLIMLTIPLLALISSLLGIGFGVGFFLAAFTCYRIIVHFQKSAKLTEAFVLIISLIIGGIVYFAADVQGYVFKDIILYLIITQLLFLMMGKVLTGVMNSSITNKEKESTRQSKTFIGVFAGLFLAAIIGSIVFPFVFTRVLSLVVTGVSYVLAFISRPLFDAVDNVDKSSRSRSGGSGGDSTLIPEENPYVFAFINDGDPKYLIFFSVLGIILLAFLFIWLGRKRFVKQPATVSETYQYSSFVDTVITSEGRKVKRKRSTPQIKVRKLIYELEIMAGAKGLGRYHYESIREWLMRNSFLENRLVELYEKVRYGDVMLTDEEDQACEEIIKQLKSKIRGLKKSK